MGYITIENFRFGLDTRRLDLNSRPGVLVDLINAHVDQGGQVEKRKAFVKTAIASSIDPTVVTKGFQEGPDGIYVFSNRVDPGGWPTGIKMQSLFFPDLHATNTTYILRITSEIDSILYSTVFAGRMFVIAKFVNGTVLAFYDGVPITDLFYGIKLDAGQLNTGFLADLAVAINATGIYTASQPGGAPTTLDVYGPPGTLYVPTITKVSAAGTLTATLVDTGIPGVVGTAAVGSFQIVTGTEAAGHQITQVTVGVTNLFAGGTVVLYNDSPERTASDVVVAINANSAVSGYLATANGRTVSIFAVATGVTANGLDVTITAAVDVCIGLCRFNFTGTGFTLDRINVDGVNILTSVLTFPTPVGETLTAFCLRVKANINAYSGTSGYLSDAISNGIFLSKVVTKASDVVKNVSISVTPASGTGAVYVGDIAPFLVSVSTPTLQMAPGPPQGREQAYAIYTSISSVTVSPIGGVPPYTYKWRMSNNAVDWGYIVTPNSATTAFRGSFPYPSNGNFTVECEVQDSSGLVAVSPTVTISW